MEENLKNKTANSFIWAYGERLIAQMVSVIVSIVLARLLTPNEYGVVAIVTVFISFADIFVTGGFGVSLVQKKEVDSLDYNTAFFSSLAVSCLIYSSLFVASKYLADFYSMPILIPVTRVMGLRLFIASINTVQHAFIQKRMLFKKFFYATLVGTIISAVIGISLAYQNFGVWALVAQYLSNSIIDTFALFILCEWKPRLEFSWSRYRKIMSFGCKVFFQQLSYTITNDIQSLVIGKTFSPADLAFYNNGAKIPNAILSNIFTTIGNVLFPALASIQENKTKQKEIVRQSIKVGVFLLAPVSIGLFAVADKLVPVIYTEKWMSSVVFLQIYCLRFLPRPHTTITQQLLLANGCASIVLKIEIILNLLLLLSLYVAVYIFNSVVMIAWGALVAVVAGVILYSIATKKIMGYNYSEQIVDVLPGYLCASIMGGIVYCEQLVFENVYILLIIQVVSGIMFYIILSRLINKEQYILICNYLKKITSKTYFCSVCSWSIKKLNRD